MILFFLCVYLKDNNLTITKLPLFEIFYLVWNEWVMRFFEGRGGLTAFGLGAAYSEIQGSFTGLRMAGGYVGEWG